jgi:hypothetical protein
VLGTADKIACNTTFHVHHDGDVVARPRGDRDRAWLRVARRLLTSSSMKLAAVVIAITHAAVATADTAGPIYVPGPYRVMVPTGEPLPAPPEPPPPPEPTVLVGVEFAMLGIGDLYGMLTIGLDGGWRIPGHDLWVRAGAHGGTAIGDTQGGGIAILSSGIEWRGHVCWRGCTYAGVELAWFTGSFRDDPIETDETGGIARLRAGIDLGGQARVRLGLEIDLGAGREHQFVYDGSGPSNDMFATRRVSGFAFTFAALVGN